MRVLAVRLLPQTDLRAELARLVREHDLRAGFILSGVGSLSRARLRAPGAAGAAEVFHDLVEPLEIVSMTGTLCPDGPHVHLSLARADGACVGGHLVSGCLIRTTAELVIGEAPDVVFSRRPDPATGSRELHVQPRRRGDAPGGDESGARG